MLALLAYKVPSGFPNYKAMGHLGPKRPLVKEALLRAEQGVRCSGKRLREHRTQYPM